jgi:ribonuclease BN (tRNA processing enzyme)
MKTFNSFLIILIILTSCSREYYERKDNENSKFDLKEPEKTRVVLLGTGNPNADPERSGPAVAIIINNESYLIDCGPGIVRRAAAAKNKGFESLAPKNLKRVFITHLHSDHTVGLPDLIFTPWVLGRDMPLKIIGPKGTKSMADHILQAYNDDIRNRIDGPEPANTEGYKVNVTEYKEGLIYQDSNINVYAYKVEHGSWQEAYAFQFVTKDRVITVSGDCRPCEGIIAASMGCDILVHEVYSYIGFLTRTPEWQAYHEQSHTSTYELAELAQKVKPKLLVMYHVLSWGAKPEVMVNEVKQNYKGKVVCGSDLDVY